MPPSQFLFSPRARLRARKWAAPRKGASGSAAGRLQAGPTSRSPEGHPGGGGRGQETAARGPAAGAARRWSARSRCFRSIRAASRSASPAAYLFSVQAREPMRMVQRGRGSSGGSGRPRGRWAFRGRRGGGAGCPRPGGRIPSWSGRRPPGGAAQAAALCAPGEPSVYGVQRRAPGRRRTRCSEGSLASVPAAGRRAGLGGLPLTTTPPPLPRQPPPRRLRS